MIRLGAVAMAALFAVSSFATPAGAQEDPPDLPDNRRYQEGIEADAFGSICDADIPYLQFRIRPTGGFTPSEPVTVTLTIRDSNGAQVGVVTLVDGNPFTKSVSDVDPPGAISAEKKFGESYDVIRENGVVTAIEGRILYPLADVTDDGTPIRWPGFILADNGDFIEVPGEESIRSGLSATLSINPDISTNVGYPTAAGEECGQDDTPTSSVAGSTTTLPARECEAGDPDCEPSLPATGSESQNLLQVAALVLTGGLILFAIARRRSPAPTPPPAG